MTRTIPAAMLVASLALPGCCSIARVMCGIKAPESPAKGTRDSPEEAVDYLVDAFRNRRINDIYTSLHPQFRRENGDFTQEEFAIAYEKFEEDFLADAESLAAAVSLPVEPAAGDAVAWIRLLNESTGAEVLIGFEDRPRISVVTSNEFVGAIEGPFDMAGLVGLEGGSLRLPAEFPLSSIENVHPETVSGLTTKDVRRVEIHHDWLVRAIPRDRARNIRFLDRIKEYVQR